MRGKLRYAWGLIVVCSLISYASLGPPLLASEPTSDFTFTGVAEIDGPVRLQISVSPPVSRPRDTITVELVLTNRLDDSVAPTVELSLPSAFSSSLARYPAGTTFDYRHGTLSWQPVLGQNGDVERLSLDYNVAVADISQPEQKIDVQLSYGDIKSSTSAIFWIGTAPSAAIVIEPQVIAVGQPVKLQAHPGGPGPYTQSWELGDGRQIMANDPEVSFGTPGIYEVTVRVANPLAVASAISAVTVVSQPAANFSIDDELPVVGQSIQFINESGGERPLSSHWNFGDGAESRDENPSHTYMAPGIYNVRLVLTSSYGQSEFSLPVSVGANPVADMVLPERARTGEPVQAMGFGDDSVASLEWDMGDGRRVEGDVIIHTYHRAGAFLVTLYAKNEHGETQVSRQIHVESGLYSLYLPLLLQPWTTESSPTSIDDAAAPPTADVSTTPAPVENTDAGETQVIPVQSGSTAPNPGGAAAEPAQVSSQPIGLPSQSALATDATTAEQLLWYVNEARRLHGLSPLIYNYALSIAAQQHTVDMAQNPDVMHVGSDGSHPADRQRLYGYLGAYGGEAVAWGWESPIPVVEYWVNSPPHRTLILNPDVDEIGVGFTADGYAPNIWYWAIEFGILP